MAGRLPVGGEGLCSARHRATAGWHDVGNLPRCAKKRAVFLNRYGKHRFDEPPVFCEQCPRLAMVEVQHCRLCSVCMRKIVADKEKEWIKANTRPLDLKPVIVSEITSNTTDDGSNQVA